jgi:flavin reductase (DIM6/NTAB) family NADH-FMN oxidoreductase RutF
MSFQAGGGQAATLEGTSGSREFESLDPSAANGAERYKLFMGSVIPRPIAFVCTRNAHGKINVAPFSNFMVVSSSESLLAFSVGPESSDSPREKDTLRNARANGEFVINTVPMALAEKVQKCSQSFPPDVSEVEEVGLTLIPSVKINTPRIAETRVQFECQLHSILPFGDANLVIGRVVLMHAEQGLVRDYKIDPGKYTPLGRIGGRTYCGLGELIHV